MVRLSKSRVPQGTVGSNPMPSVLKVKSLCKSVSGIISASCVSGIICLNILCFVVTDFQESVPRNGGITEPVFYILSVASRLIWVAIYPTPNPLSILTTAIPLAQELIIVSSADKPCRLAP